MTTFILVLAFVSHGPLSMGGIDVTAFPEATLDQCAADGAVTANKMTSEKGTIVSWHCFRAGDQSAHEYKSGE